MNFRWGSADSRLTCAEYSSEKDQSVPCVSWVKDNSEIDNGEVDDDDIDDDNHDDE